MRFKIARQMNQIIILVIIPLHYPNIKNNCIIDEKRQVLVPVCQIRAGVRVLCLNEEDWEEIS